LQHHRLLAELGARELVDLHAAAGELGDGALEQIAGKTVAGGLGLIVAEAVQATLGSKIRVNTVSGKKVVLKIPKGTQSGTKFRIRGQGIQKEGRIGDQYVEVVVQVPEELTDAERKAMEEFADASGLKH
jgi:hypothetical protein